MKNNPMLWINIGCGPYDPKNIMDSRYIHLDIVEYDGYDNFKLIEDDGNGLVIPLDDNSVLCARCINCFHHFGPTTSRMISELSRVMCKEGIMVIVDPWAEDTDLFKFVLYEHWLTIYATGDPCDECWYYNKDDAIKFLTSYGFEVNGATSTLYCKYDGENIDPIPLEQINIDFDPESTLAILRESKYAEDMNGIAKRLVRHVMLRFSDYGNRQCEIIGRAMLCLFGD